jgi:hypothetical protein
MVDTLVKVLSFEDLMLQLFKMDKDNSVCQVFIPGKGKFTIVLQEEECQSIAAEVKSDPQLKNMIQESREEYAQGKTMTTTELIKSLSSSDF